MEALFLKRLFTLAEVAVVASLSLAHPATVEAQEAVESETKSVPSMGEMKANIKTGETPIPSPFDAFLALDQISKAKPVDWKSVFDAGVVLADADTAKGPVELCLMLGVKVSDGLIAIKAKDVDALNDISRVIEGCAKKLGVDQSIINRAEKVRTLANEDDWLGVFLELGFLQENIIEALKKEDRKDQRAIILAAGWIQGARHAATAIEKNYSEAASNLLREPDLIGALHRDLTALSEPTRVHPVVQAMISAFPELQAICDVPQDGVVPLEKVAALRTRCADLVKIFVP